jgi:hypothetical protein
MERVKGIEPSSPAWEAGALPLSYTRPVPKGMDALPPKGTAHRPLSGLSVQTYLAIGYHVEVSALSRRGDLCIPYPTRYRPAFAFSTILYPLWLRTALRPSWSAKQARHHMGLTLFRAESTDCEGSAFSPVIVCQRIRTKQADIRSHAILARARYDKSRLAPSSLTTFNSGSLTLTLQSSLAPRSDATSERMPIPSRGRHTPLGEATLSVRLARHRYWRRTARTLLAAERQVILRAMRPGMTTLYAAFAAVQACARTISFCCLTALDRRSRISGAAVSKPTRLSGRTLGKLLLCH